MGRGASVGGLRGDDWAPGAIVSTTLVSAVTTGVVLGVTHAVEPDHVAGIASLTGRFGDTRLSAVVGACFSFGHVVLVIGWLGVGSLILRRTTFPPVFDIVGTLGVAVLLCLLGTGLAVGGVRRMRHAHTHEHDASGVVHQHAHLHVPLFGDDHDHDAAHSHDHTVRAYLKTGVVGALFTLSPPLSMIAFSATLFSAGAELVMVAVVAYAVSITATMSALGAGAGTVFQRAGRLNARVHGGVQTLAGVLVVGIALSVSAGIGPLPA